MKDACVLSAVISVHNEVTDLCGCFFKYGHFSLSQELIFIKSESHIKTENCLANFAHSSRGSTLP